MLVGLNKETGEKIYAFSDTDHVKKLTEKKILICQECGSPLILKAGLIKIHHFAHSKCVCTYKYGESETENHIRGKLEMSERLKKLYPNSIVELEYKVKETNQRSDVIVLHPNGDRWAFEIQCSRIPISTLIERSNLYKEAGVIDFWFIGYEYSSYFSYSNRQTFKSSIDRIKQHIFRIFFSKKVEVGLSFSKDMLLSGMLLKKNDLFFELQDYNSYKKACKLYKKAINDFYEHLTNTYSNSNTYLDYNIGEHNEKADILLVNKKKNNACAFNFIFPFLNNRPLLQRVSEYQNQGITDFWFYGNFEYKNTTCYENEQIIRGSNVFTLEFDEGKWTIVKQSGGYLNSRISLANLEIAYKDGTKELALKDHSKKKKLTNTSMFKRIGWEKYRGTWSGTVYECPKSLLENHFLGVKSLQSCVECEYFAGYIYNGRKKTSIKCVAR